jgi:hypothetical protein
VNDDNGKHMVHQSITWEAGPRLFALTSLVRVRVRVRMGGWSVMVRVLLSKQVGTLGRIGQGRVRSGQVLGTYSSPSLALSTAVSRPYVP